MQQTRTVLSEKPLVTALICNFNYGRYIAQAIESALTQTWTHLEIVVVDDGSTDDSRQVIDQFGNKIRAIYKDNGGQASAFNVGLNAMRGEIVCFLDSDDLWCPQKVERVVEKFKSGQWGLVCHGVEDVDENCSPVSADLATHSKDPQLHEGCLLDYIERNGCPWIFSPTSGMSLRAAIARKLTPLPEKQWRICADNLIAFGSIAHAPVGVIPEKLCRYRHHETNKFAGLGANEAKRHITITINRAKRYLFLSEQLAKQGYPSKGSPKKHYRYYRDCCLFSQARPWRKLCKLWQMSFAHAFSQEDKMWRRFLGAVTFAIADLMAVILIALGMSPRYRVFREEFKRASVDLDEGTLLYMTSE